MSDENFEDEILDEDEEKKPKHPHHEQPATADEPVDGGEPEPGH